MNKTTTFLLIVLLFSCHLDRQRQSEDENKPFEQDFFDFDIRNSLSSPQELFLSNFANEIRYIPLETTPSCLLSEIRDLKIFKDNVFILDKKALYKFDENGNFTQQMGKIGRGPGEYGQVLKFTIIEESNEIMLYCYPAGRINVYDFDTGIFKRDFRLNIDTNGFTEFPPGKISFFTSNMPPRKSNQLINNEIYISNLDGKIIDSIPNERLPHKGNISSQTIYYHTNSSLCYMGSFQDTLTILSSSPTKKPYVNFDLKNKVKGNELEMEFIIGEIQFPDFLHVESILENDKYFFIDIEKGFQFGINEDILRFLYNKASDQLIHCSYLNNDIDEGLPFWPKYIDNNKVLIDVYYPYQMIEYFESNLMNTGQSNEFTILTNKLNVDDNPILAFVKLQ